MSTRRRRFRSRPKPQLRKPPANEEIKASEVRLIGEDGSQIGVVSLAEARAQAAATETDLVVVAAKANPPAVRLMNLGKYMYEKRKKDAKQKAKNKGGEIKGIRLGFKTDEHDWNMRLKQAAAFLQEGNKVKLEMRLRGREKSRGHLAAAKLREFVSQIEAGAKIEGDIGRSHRGVTALLTRA